jgi:2-polyprenyl-6-methoxyphenol hydroxylase-like FAD-dependent oxidoreductase
MQGARRQIPERESLWPNESWVFGNYKCDPGYAFSHLLFEFRGDCEDLTISNCIFLPLRKQVNIAVTVSNPDIPGWHIKDIIATQAAKILDDSGVRCSENRVAWHSNHGVRITSKTADRCHFGRNVVLLGDAMGANSPVAALGGTLSTSAYSYAIRHLIRDLEIFDAELALARYRSRAQSYVNRWHNKVTEIGRAVDLEIRHKTKQLVAVSSTRREMSVVSAAL